MFIINRENVMWLTQELSQFGNGWLFDMVVIDELSSFKSSKAQRFRALRKYISRSERVVGLTGTPAPNGLMDLWSEMYLIDGGERLGKTITGYRERYFTPNQRNQTTIFNYKPKADAEKAILDRISDICVSMQAEDWLDMPERINSVISVKMTPEQQAAYEKFEKEAYIQFREGEATAATAAVLTNKLLQYSNGAVYTDTGEYGIANDNKLDALSEIIEAAGGKPILCFYSFRHDLERIKKKFRFAKKLESADEILRQILKGFKPSKRPFSGEAELQGDFFGVNDRKLDALINAVRDDMERAEYAVLRRADDQYRQVIYNAHVYANTGAGTYQKAVDMATRDYLRAGIDCVEYKDGSRHTLEDYADMAIKTANKRAYLQGEGSMRDEWGIPTVIMNKRNCPCPKCAPFVGKVFIDDVWSGGQAIAGTDKGISPVTGARYPLLSAAIRQGLYHPRCKDVHSTYFEGISTPPEGSVYTADELDTMAQQYSEEQKQGYCERQEKRYTRMSKYSLDDDNKRMYSARAKAFGEKAEQFGKVTKTVHSISTEDITKNPKNSIENGDNGDIIKYSYKSNVRADVKDAINSEYEAMASKFGEFNTISSVEPLTWGSDSTYGEFDDNSGVLAIRFADKKDCLKKLAQKATEMKKTGKWSTSHPMHVIRHEMGHAIQLEHLRNDDLWSDKLKRIKLIMDSVDDKAVSLYAKEDIDEFISECISESMTKKARKTSKAVVNIILGDD